MKRKAKNPESGMALFMVISALALLTVLIAELTYSSQLNSRLAYNFVDGLKAQYLAKAAYKLSLVRLKAYLQVNDFLKSPSNKQVAGMIDKNIIEQIWAMPFVYPLTIPKEAGMIETDAIKEFQKESKLEGSYVAGISGESTKLNLNNLLLKNVPQETAAQPAQPNDGSRPQPSPTPTPTPTPTPMEFREILEPAIHSILEQKKNEDREFADVYRNVNGKDVVDAIASYLLPDFQQGSNLPGYEPIQPKRAPMYSLSELHLIPGIDDQLYDILAPALTVQTTPGININKITKQTLLSLVPEMTEEEAEDVIRRRDDPDVGKPWEDEKQFWDAIGSTTAGRNLSTIQDRFKKAGMKIITSEQLFKVGIQATVGMATRRLEAYVIADPNAKDKKAPTGAQPANPFGANTPGVNVSGQGGNPQQPGQPGQQDASGKKSSGLTLIYWRML